MSWENETLELRHGETREREREKRRNKEEVVLHRVGRYYPDCIFKRRLSAALGGCCPSSHLYLKPTIVVASLRVWRSPSVAFTFHLLFLFHVSLERCTSTGECSHRYLSHPRTLFIFARAPLTRGCASGEYPSFLRKLSTHRWTSMAARSCLRGRRYGDIFVAEKKLRNSISFTIPTTRLFVQSPRRRLKISLSKELKYLRNCDNYEKRNNFVFWLAFQNEMWVSINSVNWKATEDITVQSLPL